VLTSEEEMVRVCAVPNCGNKMRKYKNLNFHRLPLRDREILPLWLDVLQLDVKTPIQILRAKDYRVCSEHFDKDDYTNTAHRGRLKKNAIPWTKTGAATVEGTLNVIKTLFILSFGHTRLICKNIIVFVVLFAKL